MFFFLPDRMKKKTEKSSQENSRNFTEPSFLVKYSEWLRPHLIAVIFNWSILWKFWIFVIASLRVEQLGSNKTRLPQPKTKSMWGYLSLYQERGGWCILHTIQFFNSAHAMTKNLVISRGNSNNYDCIRVRTMSFAITEVPQITMTEIKWDPSPS